MSRVHGPPRDIALHAIHVHDLGEALREPIHVGRNGRFESVTSNSKPYMLNVGNGNTVSGIGASLSMAVGVFNSVSGGLAVGLGNLVSTLSLGVGQSVTAYGSASAAVGQQATATGDRALAVGAGAESLGPRTTAIGDGAQVAQDASRSVAVGSGAACVSSFSVALGVEATARGAFSTALGPYASASSANVVTFGGMGSNSDDTLSSVVFRPSADGSTDLVTSAGDITLSDTAVYQANTPVVFSKLPVFANMAAAISGGLPVGGLYFDSGVGALSVVTAIP